VKSRTHLLNEADHLLIELPLELREQLPQSSDVRRLSGSTLGRAARHRRTKRRRTTRRGRRPAALHRRRVRPLQRFGAAALLIGRRRGEPVRHRFNPHGNRRVNCVLHHMALTQLRCDPRARQLYDHARQRGHTKTEAMRVLKRRLSDVIHRRMIRDLESVARAA
jgi:Transposase IS116/IS110/IS902 family